MKDIAVCIVIKDLYYQTRFCIENLIEKTSLPIKMYFFNNNSTDERIIKYLELVCDQHSRNLLAEYKKSPDYTPEEIDELVEKHRWEIIHSSETLYPSHANNSILKFITNDTHKHLHDFICFYPINIFITSNGWLEDLVSSCEIVYDAGLVSIRTGDEKVKLTHLLHRSMQDEDTLKNVWFTENNSCEGIFLFNISSLEKVGMFDEHEDRRGFEQLEFAFRFAANGFKNYYIIKQTATKVDCENEILFPKKTEYNAMLLRKEIETMVIDKRFKK